MSWVMGFLVVAAVGVVIGLSAASIPSNFARWAVLLAGPCVASAALYLIPTSPDRLQSEYSNWASIFIVPWSICSIAMALVSYLVRVHLRRKQGEHDHRDLLRGRQWAHRTEVAKYDPRLLQEASSCGGSAMILGIRAVLFFGLIWAVTSFAFTAGTLATLLGQTSYISVEQLRAVAATSAVATVVALGLVVLLVLHLLGKGTLARRFPARALMVIGLGFCAMAAYSFLIAPADQQEDFFRRFANGARFEFLLVGLAALITSVRTVWDKSSV